MLPIPHTGSVHAPYSAHRFFSTFFSRMFRRFFAHFSFCHDAQLGADAESGTELLGAIAREITHTLLCSRIAPRAHPDVLLLVGCGPPEGDLGRFLLSGLSLVGVRGQRGWTSSGRIVMEVAISLYFIHMVVGNGRGST